MYKAFRICHDIQDFLAVMILFYLFILLDYKGKK